MTTKDFQTKSQMAIFASYYKPHLWMFLLDMACALGIALVDLAFPMASKYAMDHFLPVMAFQAFFAVIAILLLAYVLRSGMYFIVGYIGHLMGVRIEADIRSDLFTHMQELSFSFYDKNRTGHLMSRVTNDLFEITELSHHGPEDLFISLVTLLGAVGIMWSMEWRLALVVCIVLPLFVVFTVVMRRRMMRASLDVKQKMAGINGELESSISGMRTAKAFANEDQEIAKFSASNDRFRGAKRGYYKAMATYQAGLEFALPVMSVLIIAFGGLLIMRGEMGYSTLITFSLYISTFLTPIRKLAAFVEQFMQGMAGFQRFVELMRQEPEIKDSPDAEELGQARGDIRLEDVSFSYDNQVPVLEHVSLHVSPGETVAVVGPSGGGKSTAAKLAARFWDVDGGRITLGGVDVKTVEPEALLKSYAIVFQDVVLFHDTILENIRLGRKGATDQQVLAAARAAQCDAFVQKLPDGYQTVIGENGSTLSGGERQRISIARALLKDAPVILLDEATASLDVENETAVQAALSGLVKDKTVLIIAHRMRTVAGADRVVVLEHGRVAQQGSPRELMEQGGLYRRMVELQNESADWSL